LNTYKGRVTFGKQFTNGVNLLLSGTIYDSAGAERLVFYKGSIRRPKITGLRKTWMVIHTAVFFGSLATRILLLKVLSTVAIR